MSELSLTITDDRTGKSYTLPIENGTVRAMDLRQIKTEADDFGLMTYDPALMNTASTKSAITFIDGDKGILEYRGYPVEQLAERSNFLEVAYLILFGDLPNEKQLAAWTYDITHHTFVHENIKTLMQAFRYDAHPMGMFISTVAALSTFYPDANKVSDADNRLAQIKRLIARCPTIAAYTYRHNRGLRYIYPDNDLSYTGNFLNMMFKMTDAKYTPNRRSNARSTCFSFCTRTTNRIAAPTRCARSVQAALIPTVRWLARQRRSMVRLHGGANEEVLKMLSRIDDTRNIPEFIQRVKNGEGKLMGFGHRVYKNYDPRARITKRVADEVFKVTGRNRLLDIALELERIALEDEYFISRKLYPNVDFYSGIIYQAMGLPEAMFPVMFAIPRAVGWLAQWQEMIT
jgi:citrate synthase